MNTVEPIHPTPAVQEGGDCRTQGLNPFEAKLMAHGRELKRTALQTLQINVGRKCNQACHHCHVDAGPWRTEMMSAETARRVGEWIQGHRSEERRVWKECRSRW